MADPEVVARNKRRAAEGDSSLGRLSALSLPYPGIGIEIILYLQVLHAIVKSLFLLYHFIVLFFMLSADLTVLCTF